MDTNELIFFDYANCLRLQERQFEAIDQYLYFKQNGMRLSKYAYLEPDVNNYLETCRYAIKNKGIVNDNNTYTVENMDFYVNSVNSEYTPVFIEEDSLLLFNARFKDFETEEITLGNKYYENIYYFDLVESVSSSYYPDRITGKGYGETRLVNECGDGVNCPEEKHQESRRTEFIIVRL